jgi:hypothetical protein
VNLWNWTRGKVRSLQLRLDGFSARPAEAPGGRRVYHVVFAAREGSWLPFASDSDFELYEALLVEQDTGNFGVARLCQLTYNAWDDTEPAFSPDGHWIVYVSEELGVRNIGLLDGEGGRIALLTESTTQPSYHPVVLPDNEQCLFVAERSGVREFRICGLDGRGERTASQDDLKRMLFSWDDGTRHRYLLTQAVAQQADIRMLMDLPNELDFSGLVVVAEWNSPELRQYREKILAARAATREGAVTGGPEAYVGLEHMIDTGVLLDETPVNPGDRASQGFTRYLFSLYFPLFRGSLLKATGQRDMWQEVVYSQTYLKRYNELVYKIALAYTDYSEQTAVAALLRKRMDLDLKRRFIWEVRVNAGKELPAKLDEADAYIAETEADLQTALGKVDAARARLCALLGVDDVESIEIVPASMEWEEEPFRVPDLRTFQGLAQINHPDIGRMKFLELRAAAIRDMGPDELQERPTLRLTYGLGVDHFFGELVDDFISMGLGQIFPLQGVELSESYKERWTHEILAYRHEREQLMADLNADLAETYAALQRTHSHLESTKKWRDEAGGRVRLERILAQHAAADEDRAPDVIDRIQAEGKVLQQRLAVVNVRAEFWRHIAQYYYRAGLSRTFLDVVRGIEQKAQGTTRSVWLWKSLEVVQDPAMREEFFRFCSAQGVSRVYCFVSRVEGEPYLKRHRWEFGYFLDLCKERGIEVYALAGNPQWLEDDYREEVAARIESIVEFNARSQRGGGGFAGIKLDVEPHALPEWKDERRRQALAWDYLDMLDYVRALMGPAGADLRLAADVSYRYADVPVGQGDGTLVDAVCDRVDEFTIMAYLTDPQQVVAVCTPLLEAAAERGVEVEVGVETTPGEAQSVTFAGRSPSELVLALDSIYEQLMGFGNFTGFAIHDYESYSRLTEADNGH